MSNKTFSIIDGRLRITYPGYTGPDQYDLPCDDTLEFTKVETAALYELLEDYYQQTVMEETR